MKGCLKIILLSINLTVLVFSQDYPENYQPPPDSVLRFQGIIPPVEYQYDMSEFYIAPLFNQIPDEVLFEDNSSTVWLRTELLLSNRNMLTENGEVNTHFTSPLYQQYLKDSEFDMVRYVLGTVQAGAVAYMAYRHIKKYGFWK
jgi:hypothetical protein